MPLLVARSQPRASQRLPSQRQSAALQEKGAAELNSHGFLVSMARTGNPYENAMMESFFKTLKYEEVNLYEMDYPARLSQPYLSNYRGAVHNTIFGNINYESIRGLDSVS